jgi:hypothetical protein
MISSTPTLLDPFEVTQTVVVGERASGPRIRLNTLDEITEWFDRAATLDEIAFLEEISQPPPWSPEPLDVRWRARGWEDEVLD